MNRFGHTRIRSLALLASAAGAVIALVAGCGGDSASPSDGATPLAETPASATAFNDADVMFAQQMIPHHQQVVDLAKLAQTKASSAGLKRLAADMKAADTTVVSTITTMLTGWGKPTAMEGEMAHGSMPGMTSEKDVDMLKSMSGTEFDRMFIQVMIAHHNGSMQMTMEQQSNGASPEAKALAGQMHQTQTEQVARLQEILDSLP
ncbi:DUF305 domain-containing protein [Micromonospora sp. CPCC 206061]|uniref:DUF305 domain-containing protein n=1 Tax=Micromonospora sp. CPCC 206061 TaxID=3122410 RepID=UPI002FF3BF82